MKNRIERVESLLRQPDPNPDEALRILKPMVQPKDTQWPVLHYIGTSYMYKKKFETALKWLQKAIRAGADKAVTYHALSLCHYNMGAFDEAITFGEQALEKEDFYKGWLHLGAVYRAKAELKEALKCYEQALNHEPDNSKIASKIAEIYRDQGNLDKAIELFEFTIDSDPENYAAYAALAQVLIKRNQFKKAEEYLNLILKKKPDSVPAKINLADLHRKKGDYKKALNLCEELLVEYPDNGKVRLNYAVCLQELGQFDEAEQHYMQALKHEPDEYQYLSNYLMCIHYNPEQSKEDIFEAHKLWDKYFGPDERPKRPVPSVKDKEKKLRIGLISGGFQRHPVGWMITRGMENLSNDKFEVYCYTTSNKYDAITHRISGAADHWQSVINYEDEIIAGMIREDEIDILVELSGHAADNRLRTVALEPASIIVKWVGGLFNTTGLESIDYLITDQYESPAGEEEFYTEKLVRMPDDYISYLPPDYAPDVNTLPSEENGFITLGCFNNPSKINGEILSQWANIMNRLPDSRLYLKSKQYDTEALRSQITSKMEESGISEDRITFEGHTKHDQHLSCYNQVDIALDPWPYSGGLTTCEALWMGVPVITKPGPTFAGRHSTTHLNNAGFPEWVVDTWDEYVEKTVALANDPEYLEKLRKGMRQQVADSPLCDGRRFAAHLATAFREMWKQRVDAYENESEDWQDHIEVKSLLDEEVKARTANRKVEAKNAAEEENGQKDIETKEVNKKEQKNGKMELNIDTGLIQTPTNGTERKEENSRQEEKEYFKIQTKDGVTVCTPPDLSLLTPYVLLEQEQWFEPELDFIREYLQSGMKVVDVGAGFGVYSLPMAKIVGESGKVFAFEPGSVTQQHLEMSKVENQLHNLEVIDRAVSNEKGKAKFRIAETLELSKIDEEGLEEVSQVTLDDWWEFEGKPEVDLIKIDINGDELKAMDEAETLLAELSPVVTFAIGEGKPKLIKSIKDKLNEKGYRLFEYVAGLKLLTPHNFQEESDPYLMNLIAIKDGHIEEFKEAGWLYDENFEPDEPEADLWKKVLGKLPWTESVYQEWGEQDFSEENTIYLKALNYLCAAEQINTSETDRPNSRSAKGTLMLESLERLIQLYNSGNHSLSLAMTLSRVLNALGKRGQAAEVMEQVMETNMLGQQQVHANLPFMLPLSEQDHTIVQTNFHKWLTVRTVEALITLKNVSTYLSGAQELDFLNALEGNPENRKKNQKRNILAGNLHNENYKEDLSIDADYNQWFWNRFKKEQNSQMAIGANGNDSIQEETPSEVINVKVAEDSQSDENTVYVKIPRKEIFRLNNIFNDDEYSLPRGFKVKDGGVIVDVGANVGAFALYARRWNKNAMIHCFEPNPQVVPLLKENIGDMDNVTNSFVALGDIEGELILSQHPLNTGQSTTSHKVKGGKNIDVKVRPAGTALKESGIRKIDVLKIDTEGAEVSILNGMKGLLPYTKVIMLEYHTEEDRREIDRLLKDFRLYSADVQKLWGIGTVKYVNKKLLKND